MVRIIAGERDILRDIFFVRHRLRIRHRRHVGHLDRDEVAVGAAHVVRDGVTDCRCPHEIRLRCEKNIRPADDRRSVGGAHAHQAQHPAAGNGHVVRQRAEHIRTAVLRNRIEVRICHGRDIRDQYRDETGIGPTRVVGDGVTDRRRARKVRRGRKHDARPADLRRAVGGHGSQQPQNPAGGPTHFIGQRRKCLRGVLGDRVTGCQVDPEDGSGVVTSVSKGGAVEMNKMTVGLQRQRGKGSAPVGDGKAMQRGKRSVGRNLEQGTLKAVDAAQCGGAI